MKFDPGSVVRHAAGGLYVITGHVVLEADGAPAYAYCDPVAPTREWVRDADEMDDGRFTLVEEPFYAVGVLNPTTWAVSFPAPGRSGLRHVFAQVSTRYAALRLAVTLNVLRAAGVRP